MVQWTLVATVWSHQTTINQHSTAAVEGMLERRRGWGGACGGTYSHRKKSKQQGVGRPVLVCGLPATLTLLAKPTPLNGVPINALAKVGPSPPAQIELVGMVAYSAMLHSVHAHYPHVVIIPSESVQSACQQQLRQRGILAPCYSGST
jgi:hypothetical protein